MAPITYVYLSFNDSVHTFLISYNNATATTTSNANAQNFLTAGTTIVYSYYNAITGVRSIGIDFFLQFSSGVVQAANRALYLEACLGAPVMSCTGTDNIANNYFNILNQGGLVNRIQAGTCAHTAGGDVFADTCSYSASPISTISTNSSWVSLQSYSTQFAITSGAGTSVHNDFTERIGFYYFDGTQWVLGPNVLIGSLGGKSYSSQGGYTLWQTAYYFREDPDIEPDD